LLSSLDYDECMNYKLYSEIYKKYFSDFLKLPWTDVKYRIKNNLNKKISNKITPKPKKDNTLLKLIITDKKFRNFIKKNKIIQKTNFAIGARIKELYFVFNWLEIHKPILSDSQIKSLTKSD